MLSKGNWPVHEYACHFMEKLAFGVHLVSDEEAKVNRFAMGLPWEYHHLVSITADITSNHMVTSEDRPQNLEVPVCDSFPVIDLGNPLQPIEAILKASQEFGFFQYFKESLHILLSETCIYRDIIAAYLLEIQKPSLRILEMIGEGLGLEPGYFNDISEVQLLSSNFYPPCPDPSLTLGILAHQDPSFITLVYQGDSTGLQILKDGRWINVGAISDAFIVNIGNQMEVISNGKLRSIDHRVVTSTHETRSSIATFVNPSFDCVIEPAKVLVNESEPSHYKAIQYKEYVHHNNAFGDYTVALQNVIKLES
ncbi:hypothetical protein L1887_15471 [Cichorium endivia]|nr:hypothetical protein L1887_15471 [Cichorium endivia]